MLRGASRENIGTRRAASIDNRVRRRLLWWWGLVTGRRGDGCQPERVDQYIDETGENLLDILFLSLTQSSSKESNNGAGVPDGRRLGVNGTLCRHVEYPMFDYATIDVPAFIFAVSFSISINCFLVNG